MLLAALALSVVSVVVQPPALPPGQVIHVPADQATIQQGIDAAQPGDTVLVAPGTYHETIDFHGKAIIVTSEGGAQVTVIDAGGAGPVATFASGESTNSVLSGFTLRSGLASEGGGIQIASASPTISDNIVTDNGACEGAGISVVSGSPVIQRNTITGNRQVGCIGGVGGGGVSVRGTSAAQLLDNVITGNSTGGGGGGIELWSAGTPTIVGNVITGNSASVGSGIDSKGTPDGVLVGNLVAGNDVGGNIGAGISWVTGGGALTIVNNTIAGNVTNGGAELSVSALGPAGVVVNNIVVARAGETAIACSIVDPAHPPLIAFNDAFASGGTAWGGTLTSTSCVDVTGSNGNISADPLFSDAPHGDYHVRGGSPTIDTGSNAAPSLPSNDLKDFPRIADGGSGTAIIDMGAYEFSPRRLRVTATGPGTVTASGIACGSTCTATYDAGSVLTLTATANSGTLITTWSGCDSSTASSCVVTMTDDRTVTAAMAVSFTVTVLRNGAGAGTVTSTPSAISCGSDCSASWPASTSVTLTATPAAGSMFTGWSGSCSGKGACTLTVDAGKLAVASFDTILSVTPDTVVNLGGVLVGSSVDQTYVLRNAGSTPISGTAQIDAPFTIVSGGTFSLAPGTTQSLVVRFSPVATGGGSHTLQFTSTGGNPSRVIWGEGVNDVHGTYPMSGTLAASCPSGSGTLPLSGTLSIPPHTGSSFSGTGTVSATSEGSTLTVSITDVTGALTPDGTVTGYFNFTASVDGRDAGGGTGSFNGTMSGLELDLQLSFPATTSGCSLSGDISGLAVAQTLTVATSGGGTVTSVPSGISCGSTCTGTFRDGAVITLTATPDSGSAFSKWSGVCSGSSLPSCRFTLSATTTATARFTKPFTDAALTAAATPVRALHLVELRQAIDALRIEVGLAAFPWTDAAITPGVTPVKAVHVLEARTALVQVYQAMHRSAPTFTDTTLTAGSTTIRAIHLSELRSTLAAIE